MSPERCDAVRDALSEAWLARTGPDAQTAAHLAECEACAAQQRELTELARDLDLAVPAGGPSSIVLARTRRLARLELASALEAAREEGLAPVSGAVLPPGFARECIRLLAGAVAALPLVIGWNLFVLWVGDGLLAAILPRPVLGVLAGAYVASVAGGLAFLYGSIPFVAHRRARRSHAEVNA